MSETNAGLHVEEIGGKALDNKLVLQPLEVTGIDLVLGLALPARLPDVGTDKRVGVPGNEIIAVGKTVLQLLDFHAIKQSRWLPCLRRTRHCHKKNDCSRNCPGFKTFDEPVHPASSTGRVSSTTSTLSG